MVKLMALSIIALFCALWHTSALCCRSLAVNVDLIFQSYAAHSRRVSRDLERG